MNRMWIGALAFLVLCYTTGQTVMEMEGIECSLRSCLVWLLMCVLIAALAYAAFVPVVTLVVRWTQP